ncbi:uncharacterized protein B0H18DRAFT_961091 [Fomitopsis serialis]|uniref:uncharacterized protein n=1 Tax=Fomitopsis serialis TaxID=139415 RepID=UPI002007F81D|nr:uncharacterized protein B0H18DRAFT_961091 [Neoantrodia serialis]KAH9912425.1 hypothetical protein B0H18DRAFT_961091 [Neoantrodia serialis]
MLGDSGPEFGGCSASPQSSTINVMVTRQTRAGSAAAASKSKPQAGGKKQTTSKAAAAAPASATSSNAEALKHMKEVVRMTNPDASEKEVTAKARRLLADMRKAPTEEKDRLQSIQAKSKVMMEEDADGEDDPEVVTADEQPGSGDEEARSTPSEHEPAASKVKGKAVANVESPPKPKPRPRPHKRKADQVSDKADSDAEVVGRAPDGPDKKRTKTQSPGKSAGARRVPSGEHSSPTTSPGSPGKKRVEVVIPMDPPLRNLSKEEQDVADRLRIRSGKKVARVQSEEESEKDQLPDDDASLENWESQTRGVAKNRRHTEDGSGDDSESYQVSDKDPKEDSDQSKAEESGSDIDDDEIIVKSEEKPQPKVKVAKAKAQGKKKGSKASKDEDPYAELDLEPMKSLVQHTQLEFRVYLSLENAWPRKNDKVIDRWDALLMMYDRVISKHKKYRAPKFKERYDELIEIDSIRKEMRRRVYKLAAQFRQEVKQKAKCVVEKEFLSLKVSDVGPNGDRLSSVTRADKLQNALEARIRFLKDGDTFHHGNLKMPDPETIQMITEWFAHMEQLWVAERDAPFHNKAIAEVMARQWWLGQHPEALRPENREHFDINTVPLSSNMIALACSTILVTLDESLKGNITINFNEKTYTPEHDHFKAGIDML